MNAFIRSAITMLIAACVAVAGAGSALAGVDRSLSATLGRAGVQPAAGSLKVGGATVGSGDLSVSVVGVGKSRSEGARRVWDLGSTSHVAQSTAEGSQLLSVYGSRAREHRATYEFPGRTLQSRPDGSVLITRGSTELPSGGGVAEVVGQIEAPWAKDAKGRSVATRYEVSGSRLIQVTTPNESTSYPVVADPTVTKRWYRWNIRFTKDETIRIATGAGACAALLSKGVHPILIAVSAFCTAIAVWAASARAFGKCIGLDVFGFAQWVKPWYWNC